MNKLRRRKFLMGMGVATPLTVQWQKPIINAVITPAHAQMSMCLSEDIIGDWEFLTDSGEASILHLHADGSVTQEGFDLMGEYVWVFVGAEISINFNPAPPLEPFHYGGNVLPPCNSFSGLINGSIPFSARKL